MTDTASALPREPIATGAAALERHKALARRFNDDVKNRHRLDAIDELLSPEFVDHSPVPGFAPTRAGVRALFGCLLSAFPDLRCTVVDTIAEGDKVVDCFTGEGTHRGEFMGIAPTGRRIRYDGMHVLSFRDGQVVGHRNVVDLLTLMTQLGALRPPGSRDG